MKVTGSSGCSDPLYGPENCVVSDLGVAGWEHKKMVSESWDSDMCMVH